MLRHHRSGASESFYELLPAGFVKMTTRRPSDAAAEDNSGDESQLDKAPSPVLPPPSSVSPDRAAFHSPQERETALTIRVPGDDEPHPPEEEGVVASNVRVDAKAAMPQGSAQRLPRRLQTLRSALLVKDAVERPKYILRPIRRQAQLPVMRQKRCDESQSPVRRVRAVESKEPSREGVESRHARNAKDVNETNREQRDSSSTPHSFDFSEESDTAVRPQTHEQIDAPSEQLTPTTIWLLFQQMMAEAGIQAEPQTTAGLTGRRRDYSHIDDTPLPDYCHDRQVHSGAQEASEKPILSRKVTSDTATAASQSALSPYAAMSAQHRGATKPRWEPPTNIPKLSASVEDFDWWFREMYEHLDSCNVQQDTEKLTFIRNWTTPAFNNHILSKAKHCGVSVDSLRTRFNAFCHFVTSEFTRETDSQTLLHKLHDLRNKVHTVDEAYELTERYAFCYNQKAKRAGDTPLPQRTIMMYFAGALQAKVRDYVTVIVQSQNPLAQTLEHA